jgi:hypothetical protein
MGPHLPAGLHFNDVERALTEEGDETLPLFVEQYR